MRRNSSAMLHLEKGVSGQSKIRIAVAIVDEPPRYLDLLCSLLAFEEDFEVVARAQEYAQVLKVLPQHQPETFLLDLKLPGMDGRGTLQRLALAKGKTRLILVTASFNRNTILQAMMLGAWGIVLAPSNVELLARSGVLIQCIRKVDAGEIWLDSHIHIPHQGRDKTAGKPNDAGGSTPVRR
jgi:DNA-binding NarL/FixJ family response regulator